MVLDVLDIAIVAFFVSAVEADVLAVFHRVGIVARAASPPDLHGGRRRALPESLFGGARLRERN